MMKNKFKFMGYCCIVIAMVLVLARTISLEMFMSQKHRSFLAPAGKIFERDVDSFKFGVMSDSGATDEVFETIVGQVVDHDVEFIIHLGDLVRYRNPAHFKWIAEELDEELDEQGFYIVPGNHEIYSEEGELGKASYMEMFGQPYYWFSYGDVLFIGLDSSEEKLDDIQLEWLDNVLKTLRHKYEHAVIYTHVPPKNPNGDVFRQFDGESMFKFAEIIKDKNINLILCGHVHFYSESIVEGVPVITAPASGQMPRGEEKRFGYMVFDVMSSGLEHELIYVDIKRGGDFMEVFFSHDMVKREVLYLALAMLLVGVGLLIMGRKK